MNPDFSFMLTVSKLVLKLSKGEDCSEECEAVKAFAQEDLEAVVSQLLSMIEQLVGKGVERIVEALKKIGYLDETYLNDFVSMTRLRSFDLDLEQSNQLLREIISHPAYGKTLQELSFWRSLTMTAINSRDNELLAQFIERLEQAASAPDNKNL